MKLSKILLASSVISSSLLLQSCGLSGLSGPRSNHWLYGGSHSDYFSDPPVRVKRPIYEEQGYHLSNRASPQKHQHRDLQWISSKSPNHYTIDIGSDEKAAVVARKIHKSPRSNGSAQFKHTQNGKVIHTGVIGSYPTREAAESALKGLPEGVRNGATVRQWQEISIPTADAPSPTTVNME